MPLTNFKNMLIESPDFKLISLNEDYSSDILKNNYGNVRDFFIPFESKTEVNDWVKGNLDLMESGDKIELVLLNKENEFIGMLSIRDIKAEPTFGLWIKPEAQNKGYAKKGMKLFIDWLFKNTEIQKLVYTADIKNNASNALAKSLEMKHTRDFIDVDDEEVSEYVLDA
jgi:RimJ/RimL family protein N-acetyltransferase